MANRLKEDEKNERIIRVLLKLPENRRCINCNGLVSYSWLCCDILIDLIDKIYSILGCSDN